jgi:YHS domain-containing protein
MVRGNPEKEASINGKTYLLAGEKEAEKFAFEPLKYLVTQSG